MKKVQVNQKSFLNPTQKVLRTILKKMTKYKLAKELGTCWNTVHLWDKGHYEASPKFFVQLMNLVGEPLSIERVNELKEGQKEEQKEGEKQC